MNPVSSHNNMEEQGGTTQRMQTQENDAVQLSSWTKHQLWTKMQHVSVKIYIYIHTHTHTYVCAYIYMNILSAENSSSEYTSHDSKKSTNSYKSGELQCN